MVRSVWGPTETISILYQSDICKRTGDDSPYPVHGCLRGEELQKDQIKEREVFRVGSGWSRHHAGSFPRRRGRQLPVSPWTRAF